MKINNMMKVFTLLFLGISFSASAQMLDVLGSSAVGGAMMKEELNSVNRGMKALKYTQLVQALSQSAQIIRINRMGQYDRVGRSDIVGNPFSPYSFNVGSEGNSRFYIELSGVDIDTCKRLFASGIDAIDVLVNGSKTNSCSASSKIKFVFN